MAKFSRSALEQLAQNALKSFDKTLVNAEPTEIPIDTLIEFHFGLKIRFDNLSKNGNIHGLTMFEDGCIPVYNQREKSIWQ